VAKELHRRYNYCLKEEATSYKMQRPLHNQPYRTYSKDTSTLRRRIERKIEDVLREDQFGFRRGKGTRDAIGMLRIISEQNLKIEAELCVCFIDWQKTFD